MAVRAGVTVLPGPEANAVSRELLLSADNLARSPSADAMLTVWFLTQRDAEIRSWRVNSAAQWHRPAATAR